MLLLTAASRSAHAVERRQRDAGHSVDMADAPVGRLGRQCRTQDPVRWRGVACRVGKCLAVALLGALEHVWSDGNDRLVGGGANNGWTACRYRAANCEHHFLWSQLQNY